MSASHRSISRIPLKEFKSLKVQSITSDEDNEHSPENLRNLISAKLRQFGVTTVGEFLRLSPPALLRSLNPLLNHEECQILFHRICVECAASPRSALDILSKEHRNINNSNETIPKRWIPTAMVALDRNLRGGIRVGSVTEIVGRAGVGKTQLAMQLCVMAAKFNQGAVYIDTESKMSLNRMEEMAQNRCSTSNDIVHDMNHPSRSNVEFEFKSPNTVLGNTIIHTPKSTKEMVSVISQLEEEILLRNAESESCGETSTPFPSSSTSTPIYPIRLCIIDSIAAPTRRDFGGESAHERVSALFQISQVLKRMADQLQIAVLVINQVGLGSDMEFQSSNRDRNIDGTDYVSISAALGVSWHHCVSTRLLLEHERDPHRQASNDDLANEAIMKAHDSIEHGGSDNGRSQHHHAWMMQRGFVRSASVVKSNIVGFSRMFFKIVALGVCEL